jgi:2-polyprenyl-6-methoxyphenol hydroxylase-like FAD-dependent oxidoreductase
MVQTDYQVIIAGGGPTGMMLACELGLAGVRPLVLERLTEVSSASRSLALGTRTLECFEQRGLDWFAGSPQVRAYNFGMLDLTKVVPPGSMPVRVPQGTIEVRLEERAIELGATVRRGHEVVDLDQDASGVTVHVRTDDGAYDVRGAFLVGCDGGGSTVRKRAGIDFPGTASDIYGITGEMTLAPECVPDHIGPRLFPRGLVSIIPLEPGMHRVMSAEFGAEMPGKDVPVTAEEQQAGVRRVSGEELKIGEVRWLSRFGNATRLATPYRKGRVLVAGDAAHVHFPAGGQGLNTGVQDAVNLGWKLAAEVQGRAPEGLLDSYHGERHPVGALVCRNTRAQTSLMHPLDRIGPLRDVLGEILRYPQVSKHFIEMMTALDIRYPIAYPDRPFGEDTHPLIGRRVPLVDLRTPAGKVNLATALTPGRGVLIDMTDGADLGDLSGWAGRVDVVTARPEPELTADVVLVRPDGYAAWADSAGDTDGLRLALRTWFGEPDGQR